MVKKTIVLVAAFILLFLNTGRTQSSGEVITPTFDANIISMSEIENPYVVVPSAIKNMYNPSLFPDIYLITQPNSIFTYRADYNRIKKGEKPYTVAMHGSPWNYDTDVPIIFYGKGIKKGYLGGQASLIDIAPTLAYLCGVQPPSAAKGRVLHEILRPEVASWDIEQRPKVVVLFSLDQGRNDYLNIYGNSFPFLKKHIIAKGAAFAHGKINYAKTETAVGHASVGTGTIPGLHGIIGNNILMADGSFPLAIDDGNAKPNFGHGNLSPHNILVPTLADELDRRYNNRSIILSSSSYGRAAIGIAGHGAYYKDRDHSYTGADKDIVFQCNLYTGAPYTNTDFYFLPDYLRVKENPDIHFKQWMKKYYNLDIENTSWTHSLEVFDRSPYSFLTGSIGHSTASFPWGETYTFNHAIIKKGEPEPDSIQSYQEYVEGTIKLSTKYVNASFTPFIDLWNFDLNLMIMEKEGIGKDNVPDLVFFHEKSLDLIAHVYGVYSGEVYSYLFFGDYMIQKVINWLDKNIGQDNYTIVLFGDHGGTNVISNGHWIVTEDVIEAIETKFGKGIIRQQGGDQIWLNKGIMNKSGITAKDIAIWMEKNFKWVMRAYTKNEVAGGTKSPEIDKSRQ